MNCILFDEHWANLLPFTYTRPSASIRCGILSIAEKWEKHLDNAAVSFLTKEYLGEKFPVSYHTSNWYINGTVFPNPQLIQAIESLKNNEILYDAERKKILALHSSDSLTAEEIKVDRFAKKAFLGDYLFIENVWDIFSKNGEALEEDYALLTKGRESASLSATNTHIGERLFIEEGAKVEAAILNSSTGPIYIGKGAEIMEGCVVRGGLALGENATLKLGAKIYGPTTIGPYSKVGGEVNNSVIFAYSNKGHDGFLGNSVLGEWCNLGADTNVSNLKNNYAQIKLWNYEKGGFKNTGLQFCGMMMGDHSKSGINTMFNTATVVGVSANVYGGGFPRNFIPSFAWGGSEKWMVYRFEKAMEVAEKVMERRNVVLDTCERAMLQHVFEQTAGYRNF